MKTSSKNIGRFVVACILARSVTSNLRAQTTAAQQAAAEAAQLQALMDAMAQAQAQAQAARPAHLQSAAGQIAGQQSLIVGGQPDQFSNNLASVSQWLHDTVTNIDGTPADSMQDYVDLQATTFSTSGAFDYMAPAFADTINWANSNGVPTALISDGGINAYLVSQENGVPNFLEAFDIAGAITINTTNVWPGGSAGANVNGTNTTISMWDEASPLLTHVEFSGRVSELDGITGVADHSTEVAGELAGIGYNINSNGFIVVSAAKGMSYAANVQAWSFTNGTDYAEMTASIGTNHMRLSNQSFGDICGWYYYTTNTWIWFGYWQIGPQDPRFGNYTANPASIDLLTFNAPTYLSVWAAGNSLSNSPPVQPTNHYEYTLLGSPYVTNAIRAHDGAQGGYDCLTPEACAKNNLAVGAVFSLPYGYSGATNLILAPFSSCGPTDDGRIKPDVVANGINNWVPVGEATNLYTLNSGTSFATPAITASVNLLSQLHKQLHTNSSDMLASTLKALVIETADSSTTNNGPSYRFGWGLMNTKNAAILINQDATNGLKNQIKEVMLNNSQSVQFPVVSRGGTNNPLKITICWTDPPGAPNAVTNLNNPTPKVVDDLDLRIFSPSGATNFPWILNPDLTNQTATARSAPATTGDDSRNNVEQVYVANPVTNGTYSVAVTYKGTLTNSQWVSIVINGNVAHPPPTLAFNQILQTGTNTMAVGWPAVVGGQYQVQVNTNLTTTNWLNSGGIVSARLTNVVVQVSMPINTQAFYRLLQLP